MTHDQELLLLADLNLAEANREHARWLSPTAIEEQDGALFTAAGTRSPAAPFNVAMRFGDVPVAPTAFLERAQQFFGSRDRGFSVQARAHHDQDLIAHCEKAGLLRMAGRMPGMVCTHALAPRALAHRVTCRQVTLATAEDFVTVSALAYEPTGLSPAVCRKVLSNPSRWLAPQWHVRVIYEHDTPVAAAMLLFSHGIAGVYWVGTAPSARGKGYADAIMREVTNHAFERGARCVVLQASAMGEPIYAKMGYREITTYPWFISLAKPA